jgi:hypothetical protein
MYLYHNVAALDLIPRWGFIVNLGSLSAPFEAEQRGSVTSIGTTLYFSRFNQEPGHQDTQSMAGAKHRKVSFWKFHFVSQGRNSLYY